MLAAMPAIASANELIAFPERDFLSGTGFPPGATVNHTVSQPGSGSFNASVRADLDTHTPGCARRAARRAPGHVGWSDRAICLRATHTSARSCSG